MLSAIEQVRAVVPLPEVDDADIADALLNYYDLDIEQTVAWFLDGPGTRHACGQCGP